MQRKIEGRHIVMITRKKEKQMTVFVRILQSSTIAAATFVTVITAIIIVLIISFFSLDVYQIKSCGYTTSACLCAH